MFLAGRVVGGGVPRRSDQMYANHLKMNPQLQPLQQSQNQTQSVNGSGNEKMEQPSFLSNTERKEKVRASLKRKMFTTMDEYEEVRKKIKLDEKAAKKAALDAKRQEEWQAKQDLARSRAEPFSAASLRREIKERERGRPLHG